MEEVVIFEQISPSTIIKKIRPDVIIRGDDYNEEQVRIRDKINKKINIKIFEKKPGFSTTKLISILKKKI